MNLLLIAAIWLLNFAISWWNAYACGKAWAETKAAGGWNRFMCWMGAIMSASGFTWCYLIVLMVGAVQFQIIPEKWGLVGLEIGYVIIIPGVLFSGLMITVDSWATAYRQGGVLNYGVAAYNTYAQIHNTMSAVETMGQAIGDIVEKFSGGGKSSSDDDDNGAAAVIVIVLVVFAVCAGVITTTAIISRTAGSEPLPSLEELRERKRLSEGK
ncbi:MAG: hypothetical protein K2X27_27215 [Candidatus Obscuribacterales bacterium]|nr:hypothetical protein [Candidatus Obscuribacterales bacterium]